MLPRRALLLLLLAGAATAAAMTPASAAEEATGDEADNATAATAAAPAAASSAEGTAGYAAATTPSLAELETGKEEEETQQPALAVYNVDVVQLNGETVAVEVTDAWSVEDLRNAIAAKLGIFSVNRMTITAAGDGRPLEDNDPAAAAAGGTMVQSPPLAIVTRATQDQRYFLYLGRYEHRQVTYWAMIPAPGSSWEARCGSHSDKSCSGRMVGEPTTHNGEPAQCCAVILMKSVTTISPGELVRHETENAELPRNVRSCTPIHGGRQEYPSAESAIASLPQPDDITQSQGYISSQAASYAIKRAEAIIRANA